MMPTPHWDQGEDNHQLLVPVDDPLLDPPWVPNDSGGFPHPPGTGPLARLLESFPKGRD